MKISNALHALVARIKRRDFNKRLNCSIVNVLFLNDPVKSPMLPGRRMLIVDILGTSRSPRVAERS